MDKQRGWAVLLLVIGGCAPSAPEIPVPNRCNSVVETAASDSLWVEAATLDPAVAFCQRQMTLRAALRAEHASANERSLVLGAIGALIIIDLVRAF